MATETQQTIVAAYFAEADAPSIIGTGEGQQLIFDTVTDAGRVLEQCGKSRGLLDRARLAESDAGFYQDSESISQPLAALARDCEDLRRILMQMAQHATALDAANVKAKATAITLGYTL